MDSKCFFMKKNGNDSDLDSKQDRNDSPSAKENVDHEDPLLKDGNELMERGQSILRPDTKAVIF